MSCNSGIGKLPELIHIGNGSEASSSDLPNSDWVFSGQNRWCGFGFSVYLFTPRQVAAARTIKIGPCYSQDFNTWNERCRNFLSSFSFRAKSIMHNFSKVFQLLPCLNIKIHGWLLKGAKQSLGRTINCENPRGFTSFSLLLHFRLVLLANHQTRQINKQTNN